MTKKIIISVFTLLVSLNILKAQSFNHSKIDSLFSRIERFDKGMGTISIFQNGKEIYQKNFGYSNIENGVKNSSETKYRIGSISKTFTATIIMKLIEEGRVALDSKLVDYYPQIPNASKITIEHLLQHRSGIPNFIEVEDYMEWSIDKQTKKELLGRIISGGTSFEPDEAFQYSNSNYVLLTYIAEDITEKSFSDLLNDIIVIPCNLKNTYVGEAIKSGNGEAYSYVKLSLGWKKLSETDMSVPQGSGFIVSTPFDLNLFLHCLFSEKIVNKRSLNKMLDLKDNFGLGLLQVPFYGEIGYGHTGGIDGFQSNAFYFPESKVSISLIENGVAYMLNNILVGCLSIYFGKDYDLPTFVQAIELTSEKLDKYLGVYSTTELPIPFEVTKKENTLIIQATGQQELPLEYIGNDTFQCESVDLILEFIPQENKMILKQLGMTFELSKTISTN
jgi:CubicO group peptidase (beta-lactamase class C family)